MIGSNEYVLVSLKWNGKRFTIDCFVAKNLGRKYVGIELDKDYFDVAVKRIGG